MRLTVGLWSFVSPIWKDTPSLLFLWDCPPNLPPQVQLHSTIQGIPGPAEFWANTSDMTFLAVQIAVAGETHSRAWMPAFSQMAGRRLPFPVLNWKEKEARKLPSCLACLTSPLLSSSHLTPIHLNHLRPFRDQMFLRAPSIYQVSPGQGA